jgi:CRP/FNR family transcriptional regulator
MKRETGTRERNRKATTSGLSRVALFKGISEEFLQKVEDQSEVQEVRSGHYLFRTADIGKALYVLEKGALHTFRSSGTKKLIIAELKAPEVVGEMGCVGQYLCHCSAQTTEASSIRIIPRPLLEQILEEYPVVTRRLLDLVSQRFVRVLMDLDGSSFRQLIPRLAKLLLEKADGDFIRDLTHKSLAQRLRVYRESATAALGELRKAGIIEIERKQIHILNRARLERAARE